MPCSLNEGRAARRYVSAMARKSAPRFGRQAEVFGPDNGACQLNVAILVVRLTPGFRTHDSLIG